VDDEVQECGCWNTFNFFPNKNISNQLKAEAQSIDHKNDRSSGKHPIPN
jgi:hypothetical protein